MLKRFVMNGILWKVRNVEPYDEHLIDRTRTLTVATTDPKCKTVYISNSLRGEFRTRVFLHELGHCMLVSYNLIDDIERMVKPEYQIYAEEFICNLFADYGKIIFDTAYDILGDEAIHIVPYELDQIIA